MKNKMEELNKQLKAVHRRFLENERIDAERKMNRSLSPFDFFHLLTQDQSFSWLRPFSALLADMDAFLDEKKEVTADDMAHWHERITTTLKASDSTIASRLAQCQARDTDFAQLVEKFQTLLNLLINKNDNLH